VLSKRELLRIVRTPEGHVVADPTGKRNGRGTYVHKTRECLSSLVASPGKLQFALKLTAPTSAADLEALADLGKAFPAQDARASQMKGHSAESGRALAQAANQIK
jgi:predicted RNA-binding protein YlxR (DUF448 family)